MASNKRGKIYIGTSGFSYQHWGNGVFYPSHFSFAERLAYYSSHFNTVELSATFNKLPHKESFIQWQKEVPKTFKFSVKGNQYITHLKKLTAIAEPLKLFIERVSKLKENLASIVWEIPPLGDSTLQKVEGFIAHLKKHSHVKHIFNFEQAQKNRNFYRLLEENKMTLVEKEDFQKTNSLFKGSSFRYLRLDPSDSASKKQFYSPLFLKQLAKKAYKLSLQADLFIYFANDTEGYAIKNAKELLRLIDSIK